MKSVLKLTTMAAAVCAILAPSVKAEEQTTLYGGVSINLDDGKTTGHAGATYSQTQGNTTSKVDVNTDGKKLNVTGSTTQTNESKR